jgi:MEMO1 family protein
MIDRPRLRPVEAFPVQQDGKVLIYLKDPMNLAAPIGIAPVGYFILSHFDGQHSLVDIQEAYCRQFGTLLMTDDLKNFIAMLDEHYYLLSERFDDHQRAVLEEFRKLPTRVAAHVGGVYQNNPAELRTQLDGYFAAPKGPGLPHGKTPTPSPKAIVAPHIDFHRGGPTYAWAYRSLAESDGADLYIILGTSHCGGENSFILTLKDFETPLGLVETDKEFVKALQRSCQENLFADEYLHRGEHSVEFQAVMLKFINQRRAELRSEPERPFKIVPILVSSFHPMVQSRTLPEQHPPLARFINALQDLASSQARRVCLVAGVDLAHVGRQFGDREEITPKFLRWVGDEDQLLIDRLAALDAPGFFNEIAKDQDRRRICGFSPLYALIHLLDGTQGRLLKYDQAFTPETGSAVTFTSMVFE